MDLTRLHLSWEQTGHSVVHGSPLYTCQREREKKRHRARFEIRGKTNRAKSTSMNYQLKGLLDKES